MKKLSLTILGTLLFFALSAQEIPQKISYQGKLLENDEPVTGTKSISFTIDTWTETQNVAVTNGIYSVQLGSVTPIPTNIFTDNASVSLQISIEGTNLTPQTEILSVAYAFKAEKATDTDNIAGNPVSIIVPVIDQVLKWNGTQWTPQTDESGGTLSIPAGVIVMWSGTLATIPAGWALCDGTSGTPDLTDRFIYSVNTGENPGSTGGSLDHSHTVNSHSHDVNSHSHSVNPPSTNTLRIDNTGGWIGLGDDQHSVDIPSFSSGSSSPGTSSESPGTSTQDHLPPYYKLAFILKL